MGGDRTYPWFLHCCTWSGSTTSGTCVAKTVISDSYGDGYSGYINYDGGRRVEIEGQDSDWKKELNRVGLGKYIQHFEKHEVNEWDLFRRLTNQDLKEIGVTVGGRKKFESSAFRDTPQE